MSLIVDPKLCRIIAQTTDTHFFEGSYYLIVPEPDGFDYGQASDWCWDGEKLFYTYGMGIIQCKAAAVQKIKAEAATKLAVLDWKLQRAREREQAGWGTLADVASVLAERESIRQSSTAAEFDVNQSVNPEDVNTFTWNISVSVDAPRLVSQTEFAKRFTDAELTNICEVSKSHAAIAAWLERFRATSSIDLDNLSLRTGIEALEMAGLLSAGRAEQICQ